MKVLTIMDKWVISNKLEICQHFRRRCLMIKQWTLNMSLLISWKNLKLEQMKAFSKVFAKWTKAKHLMKAKIKKTRHCTRLTNSISRKSKNFKNKYWSWKKKIMRLSRSTSLCLKNKIKWVMALKIVKWAQWPKLESTWMIHNRKWLSKKSRLNFYLICCTKKTPSSKIIKSSSKNKCLTSKTSIWRSIKWRSS